MSVTALVIQKAVFILRPLYLPNLHQGDYSCLMVSFPEASDKAAIKKKKCGRVNINALRLFFSCFTSMLNSRGHVRMTS